MLKEKAIMTASTFAYLIFDLANNSGLIRTNNERNQSIPFICPSDSYY